MSKTITSLRIKDLDNEFYRAPENIVSKNGNNTFITYATTIECYNQMFGNIIEEDTVLHSYMPNGDKIGFCKRDKQITCHNKTNNERVAFIAI